MYFLQKRRKELEEASVNDSLLLAKSSLDINLLPESEDDRNMAALLSLRPSRSSEENQTQVRSKIMNSPALPSSNSLLISFGGLKKEESLSKSAVLTRDSLGINIKSNIVKRCKDNIEDVKLNKLCKDNIKEIQLNKRSNENIAEVKLNNQCKDNIEDTEKDITEDFTSKIDNNGKLNENDDKDASSKFKDDLKWNNLNNHSEKDLKVKGEISKVEYKSLSLVGDYSSSGEATD